MLPRHALEIPDVPPARADGIDDRRSGRTWGIELGAADGRRPSFAPRQNALGDDYEHVGSRAHADDGVPREAGLEPDHGHGNEERRLRDRAWPEEWPHVRKVTVAARTAPSPRRST